MHQSKNKTFHTMVALWLLLSMSMALSLSAAPIKIMFIGDSITEGGGGQPDNPDDNTSEYTSGLIEAPNRISYRGKLFDLLIAEGYSIGEPTSDLDFVGSRSGGTNYGTPFDMDHQATSGYTSKQVRDGIDGWLTTNPSDIVLLHIGTNDPSGIPIGSDDDASDANTTVNNVKQILNTIFTKNPNTKVFVARIIEARRAHAFAGGLNGGAWNTNDLNNQVSAMVSNHDKNANIKMVDMQNGAEISYDPCGITLGDMQPYEIRTDGTYYDYHPNHKGYAKMAQKWFDELVASEWLTPITPAPSTDHFWTLESGSPYADSTGSSQATCTSSTCPQSVTGKVGNAVSFENTASHKEVLVTNVDGYDVNESYTIEFWMKPEGNTTANNEVVVRHADLWIGRSNNTLRYDLQGVGGYNNNAGTLSADWNHIALSYDGSSGEAKAYINGSVTSTSTITSTITPTALTGTSFYIGHYYATDNNNTTYGYNGAVDEVRVYRRVLTDADVLAHYNAAGEDDNNDTNTTDTTAPIIAEVTAIPEETNDTTPSYTFSSNEAGTIAYGGDCNSTTTEATDGNNTITFNTLPEGRYSDCTIAVTDDANNTSNILNIQTFEVNTTIEVPDNNDTNTTDTTPPTITLNQPNPQQIAVGTDYTELGATATDEVDGNLTNRIEINATAVNTSAEGNYTVTYNVSDTAGNAADEVNRTVVVTAPIDVNDTNTTDTDNDGIADENDLDIDGDGVNNEHDAFPLDKDENSDLDSDGIGDNADLDDDNNGIPDTEEQPWTNYNANTKTSVVNGSEIKAVGLDVMPSVKGGFLILKHVFGSQEAYVSVKENGELKTGFKSNSVDDSTLKSGTFFKAGTKSIIMKEANDVVVRTIAKFNKDETFEIGGK